MKFLSPSLNRTIFKHRTSLIVAVVAATLAVTTGSILYRVTSASLTPSQKQASTLPSTIAQPPKKQTAHTTDTANITATNPAPTPVAAPQTSVSSQSKPAVPATPKPKSSAKYTQTPCEKYIPVYYTDYAAAVMAEINKHQATMAALKQAYESNPYPGSDQVNAYYADTTAEKARHSQVGAANFSKYQSTLAAVGCYI